jgi:hypothetical protein
VLQLIVTANVVPNLPIVLALMMEAIRFSKTLAVKIATRRHFQEDGILFSHCREIFRSYIALTG